MKILNKLVLLGLLANSLFATQTIELLGDKSYPPYSYKENGNAKGVYVDVIKSAFAKIPEYNVKFKMVAWKRAIAMTKKGISIGFFPPYYSQERTSWSKFSEPIIDETSSVYAKETTLKGKVNFPKDFIGLTVCMNRGFTPMTGGKEFADALKKKQIKLIEANSNKDCLARVKRGLADFYINDQLIDISSFPVIKRGMEVNSNFGHIGFTLQESKYPFMKDLQAKFNTIIKQMKKDGSIDKIVQKYK